VLIENGGYVDGKALLGSGSRIPSTNETSPGGNLVEFGPTAELTDSGILSGDVVTDDGTQTLTNKTLTNPTITFSDNAPDYNVMVRAYRSGSQTGISSGSATVIQLNAEDYDLGGDFDNTTNYRFTAPVDGYYDIFASIYWSSAADGDRHDTILRENGSGYLTISTVYPGATAGLANNTHWRGYLSSSDYVELIGRQYSGGDETVAGETRLTYMEIMLVST
jgi:hypothetical protein